MFKIISPINFNSCILSGERVASQIATLLNNNNDLYKTHNKYSISNSVCFYLVYIQLSMVIGVTGIQVDINKNITKNKHTSVLPMFRGMGLGKLLVTEALRNCTTDTIYATIKSNNTQSINLYQSLGFVCSEYYLSNGNKILVFRRRIK